jgi:hypothetical protein
VENKIEWSVFFPWGIALTGYPHWDELLDCFLQRKCSNIKGSEEMMKLSKNIAVWIWYYVEWKPRYKEKFLSIWIKWDWNMWNWLKTSFVYRKWFFKWKEVWRDDDIIWSRWGITYIFNDDWWIISNCLYCW